MSQKFLQTQKFILAGGGISASATSIVLTSFTTPDGTSITSSDLGTTNYGTLEPGTSREEIISFTGVTQNGDGTATLTGVTRGLKFVSPYTTDSNLKQSHGGGVVFVVSNNPQVYDDLASVSNDETISGTYTFENFPKKSGGNTPTAAEQFTTKEYVDSVVGGSANYDQEIIAGTLGETIIAGKYVYLKSTDGKWYKTSASASATCENVIVGVAQAGGNADDSVGILKGGVDKTQTYTAGAKYYLSDTAGDVSTSAGTVEVYVGQGDANGNLSFDHNSNIETLTANEKDALAGTSGTPSSTNKFVTNDDTATTGANKVVRLDGSGNLGAIDISNATGSPALDASNMTNITPSAVLTAGEDIDGTTTPKPVMIDNASSSYGDSIVGHTTTGYTSRNFDSSTIQIGQTFINVSGFNKLNKIQVRCQKVGSPSFDMRINLYAVDGSHNPTGASLGSTDVVSASSTGNDTLHDFTFSSPVSIVAGIEYVAVITTESISTMNGSNYVSIRRNNGSDVHPGYPRYSNDSGSTWDSLSTSYDNSFLFVGGFVSSGAGRVAIADANNSDRNDCVGFVKTNITDGNTGSVITGGLLGGFTGLTAGSKYYLSDTFGTIGTSAGTKKICVGRAVSTTQLLVKIQEVDATL